MTRHPHTRRWLLALSALGAIVVMVGSAAHFTLLVWVVAVVGAWTLSTLADRDGFYGPRHRR